ncbi:hypothetical protein BDF14DRAFT_1753294 [Spinellus fusiger]|nr:hypothetical protein BDF14DRAFT_1753259 [Spinellus fusiger]KAI7872420.1 hypothetical protein BDF14DRAFT_1753294 [Spinellus fusiger]
MIQFESIISEFDPKYSPSTAMLCMIYIEVMAPKVHAFIISNLSKAKTWVEIANAAIAVEECLSMNQNILEDSFARLSLGEDPTPATISLEKGPELMEINAFQKKNKMVCTGVERLPHSTGNPQYRPQQQPDSMHCWADNGKPICGYCNKEGHLSKKCWYCKVVNQMTTPMVDNLGFSKGHIELSDNYAALSIEDNPLAVTHINNIQVQKKTGTVLKIKSTVQGHSVQALIDTGANVSAVISGLVKALGLTPNQSNATSFVNANNKPTTTHSTVILKVIIGNTTASLECQVVELLSQQLILGYLDLHKLNALINTTTHKVYIPQAATRPAKAASVCTVVLLLKLPAQHHAYVDIQGPPNLAALVSTPPNMMLEKMVLVASGLVNFDQKGIATVKITNLDTKTKNINKGQCIAIFEYLPCPSGFILTNHKSTKP